MNSYKIGRATGLTQSVKNILSGMAYNFRKAMDGAIDPLGTPYDLGSMMHYGQTAFTNNKKRTIQVLDWRKRLLIGQRSSFSNNDIVQLNKMYNCRKYLNYSLDGWATKKVLLSRFSIIVNLAILNNKFCQKKRNIMNQSMYLWPINSLNLTMFWYES